MSHTFCNASCDGGSGTCGKVFVALELALMPHFPEPQTDSAAPVDSLSADAAAGTTATALEEALPEEVAALLKRDATGLVAAIVQQFDTGEVLMLGWMNDEALRRTLSTGRVTFWSRSRNEYWRKGDTSGHFQYVKAVAIDCDGDALLVTVDQVGAACHTGTRTCFEGRGLAAVVGSRGE
jgi:phosphoribosyl-AMP cyclohydrolase